MANRLDSLRQQEVSAIVATARRITYSIEKVNEIARAINVHVP